MDTGIVEGFFGHPWSFNDRKSIIEFINEVGFNSYIYAPKEDPYHRRQWSELYPTRILKKFEELVKWCQFLHVDFNFALSPGLSIIYSDENHFEKLCKKYNQLIDINVSSFSIFFDDINPALSLKDQMYFTSPAQAQVFLTRKLLQYLSSKVPNLKFYFCPTEYRGLAPSPYLRYVGANLPLEIKIFWTGRTVVSKTIRTSEALSFSKIIRRKPLLWDNYPVNDFDKSRIFTGPICGRDKNLLGALSGIFFNPMNQAEISKLALTSAALYVRTPHLYKPDHIWLLLKRIFLKSAAGEIFLSNFYPSILKLVLSKEAALIKRQIILIRKGKHIERTKLISLAKKLLSLKKQLFDVKFHREAKPFLDNLLICGRLIELIAKGSAATPKSIIRYLKYLKMSHRPEGKYYFENRVGKFTEIYLSWRLGKSKNKLRYYTQNRQSRANASTQAQQPDF